MGRRGPGTVADRLALLTAAYPIYCDFWDLAKGGWRAVLVKQSGGDAEYRSANLPAEPNTVIDLLDDKTVTVNAVRAICRRSAWMAKQPNSYLSQYLPRLARRFLDAKDDRHYPRSNRPTSLGKAFWFLARALAGSIYGVSPRRAINIIGPGKPEKIFAQIGLTYEVIKREGPAPKGSRKRRKR